MRNIRWVLLLLLIFDCMKMKNGSLVTPPTQKNDFFPLKIGNYWKYDYTGKMQEMSHDMSNVGKIKFEVIDITYPTAPIQYSQYREPKLFYAVYDIKYEYDGMFYSTDPPNYSRHDEYAVVERIYQDSDNYLIPQFIGEIDYRAWTSFGTNRYQSSAAGDTVKFSIVDLYDDKGMPGFYRYETFVKNVGMEYFHWRGYGYHEIYEETFMLTDYYLAP
jgi:hypothetical protein